MDDGRREQVDHWHLDSDIQEPTLFDPPSTFVPDDQSATEDLICEDSAGIPLFEPDTTSDPMDDASATEDLVLCEPPQAHEAMLDLASSSPLTRSTTPALPEIPLSDEIGQVGVKRPGVAPRRIGSGTLVPARLTWKPGDPFGQSRGQDDLRFRWEVMLTTACTTAACGLVCVWLLHSLFA